MKVVINTCYGGFSISPKALRRYLEIKGKKGYFFTDRYDDYGNREEYIPVDIDKLDDNTRLAWVSCYSVPNPQEVLANAPHNKREDYMVDGELDRETYNKDCDEYNEKVRDVYVSDYDIERNDPILVQVVEEMGEESYGGYAKLKIVEIPDDVDWFIDEYDGMEHIAESHRTWG